MGLGAILGITIPMGYIILSTITYILLVPHIYHNAMTETKLCSCDHCKDERRKLMNKDSKYHTKENIRRIQARYHAQNLSVGLASIWPLTIVLYFIIGAKLAIKKGILRPLKKIAFRSINKAEKAEDLRRRFEEDIKKESKAS